MGRGDDRVIGCDIAGVGSAVGGDTASDGAAADLGVTRAGVKQGSGGSSVCCAAGVGSPGVWVATGGDGGPWGNTSRVGPATGFGVTSPGVVRGGNGLVGRDMAGVWPAVGLGVAGAEV